jgi:hypothetical protein
LIDDWNVEQSVGVFFADALGFVETEPVVGLGYFPETDDKFVCFLGDFGGFNKDGALSLGDCKDPIFAIISMNFDLEASVKEPGSDIFGRDGAYALERDVYSEYASRYFTNFFSSR